MMVYISGGLVRRSHTISMRRIVVKSLSTCRGTDQIPQPRGLPFIGTTLALLAAGAAPKLHIYIHNRHKQLGPVFRDQIGPISAVFLADAEEMRSVFAQEGKYPRHVLPEAWRLYNRTYGCARGLFFMDGEEWLRYRRIMNRLLLKSDGRVVGEACRQVSEELVGTISNADHLERALYRWSLNVITAVLLGGEGYCAARGRLNHTLAKLANTVSSVFENTVKLQLLPAVLAQKLQLPAWKRFVRSVGDALETSTSLVTTLLENEQLANDGLLAQMQQEHLQPQEITKLVADLILAAGDTTAYTMEWLLYLIAKHQPIQNQLRTQNPTLLKNCIRETLRLYPVAPFITRYLPTNTTISGYSIPKDTLVIMSLYTMGRDPQYFKHPETFNPERWVRSSTESIQQQASLPFAMGARSCIGRRIAEVQLQSALDYLVRHYTIKLQDDDEDVEMVLKMVAVPKQPVRLRFERIL